MAAVTTLVFMIDTVHDISLELRVLASVAAVLGAFSLLTRPMDVADELFVGFYLLSRLHPFKRHEAARIVQILLLVSCSIVSVVSHDLSFVQMLLLVAHTGFTSAELVYRIGLEAPHSVKKDT
jgi:hypothetical protein